MIKLFRIIRQRMLTQKSISKYLLYAVGEILLVMVGILLALQVNNWNERRKAKQVEFTLLTELKKSVEEDIESIKVVIDRNESYVSSANIVLTTLETGADSE